MAIKIDLAGKKIGKLKILQIAVDVPGKKKKWLCRCDCGNLVIVAASNLRSGHTTKCRRCAIEELNRNKIKHNMTSTKLYYVWWGMLNRCENKNVKSYKDYGGRGICVCEEWHNSEEFFRWALENGYEEGKELDRINNDDGYNPLNCRWTTKIINANNKRNNRVYEWKGVRMTLSEIARIEKINYKLLHKHMAKGLTLEEAILKQRRKTGGC